MAEETNPADVFWFGTPLPELSRDDLEKCAAWLFKQHQINTAKLMGGTEAEGLQVLAMLTAAGKKRQAAHNG